MIEIIRAKFFWVEPPLPLRIFRDKSTKYRFLTPAPLPPF